MITISRLLARRLRSIFCRCSTSRQDFTSSRYALPPDCKACAFSPASTALPPATKSGFRCPTATSTIPLSLLKETEGSQAEPLLLIPEGDGQVLARWQAGDIPQERRVSVPDKQAKLTLPPMPETLVENPSSL